MEEAFNALAGFDCITPACVKRRVIKECFTSICKTVTTKALELVYNLGIADSAVVMNTSSTEVVAMGDEDTVVLTPEEKDKILKEIPEGEQQDDDEEKEES